MIKQIHIDQHPFLTSPDTPGWQPRDDWPASWVAVDDDYPPSSVTAYRLRFRLDSPATFRIHVTADQRYWLFLDGRRVAQGSERGCTRKWFYETYELDLEAGEHTLGALTWHLSAKAPWAQATVTPGFLLAADQQPFTNLVSTGLAPWEGLIARNVAFLDPSRQINSDIGGGARLEVAGAPPDAVFADAGAVWRPVRSILPGNNGFRQGAGPDVWLLHPGTLLAQRRQRRSDKAVAYVWPLGSDGPDGIPLRLSEALPDEQRPWQALLGGKGIQIPPHTRRRVLIDLGDYCCGYYQLLTSKGRHAVIDVSWAERLSAESDRQQAPTERNTIDSRFFVGTTDRFRPDGRDRCCYQPLWWQAGRWVQLVVQTDSEPLVVHAFDVEETGYPLENSARFACDDQWLNAIAPVCWRTLCSCAHETYMDCPYWEQLQYVGDTRIQVLLTYATGRDDRLPRKVLDIFRYSMIGSSPLCASNYPARNVQIIPPFALWWVCMLHDYALWRGDKPFVRELLPLAWWILDHFLLHRSESGLVVSPRGWNYVDAAAFPGGDPPGSKAGQVSGILNWQVVLALKAMEDLQRWTADGERADLAHRLADELAIACCESLWDDRRAALADDPAHTSFSEHTQALALLSGMLPADMYSRVARALCDDEGLLRAGPYFSYYVCRALHRVGAGKRLVDRLRTWQTFLDVGFKTFPEHGIVSRSDCHAWNAHPLFHMLTGILGVRPGGLGFDSVVIEPHMGDLRQADGVVPHRLGDICVNFRAADGALHATIELPGGLSGQLRWPGQIIPLHEGAQQLTLDPAE